ncbi:transcriptional regulator [Desulfuromonas versatilis]|uniref:Transcriptional regulator n=1 Tax=Desulfuromonas versatilis TaxID=2802975 RepID=A0ABN6DW33_9BACT|nr:Crp/Fnr family transcriptional regulator [Desulfuromonas versatilis]BCR04355.1 transcriptional regulator [Desulfuromonas versatilis]
MSAKMQLTENNLLRILESPEYREFLSGFQQRSVAAKALVCAPYDQGDRVFVVKSGRLRVYLAYEDKEFTLALLEPGDVFSSHTRALVMALEDSLLLVTDTASIQHWIARFPAFSQVMGQVLGELLKNSISIIEGLVFKGVRERLSEFLYRLASKKGEPKGQGLLIELDLTTEDVALLLGTTRQTVSQMLNELIREGILERKSRRSLLVRDLSALHSWKDPTPT